MKKFDYVTQEVNVTERVLFKVEVSISGGINVIAVKVASGLRAAIVTITAEGKIHRWQMGQYYARELGLELNKNREVRFDYE